MADSIAIIGATLSPVFLISGAAIFLNFLQSRLFRVNDRLRALQGVPEEEPHRAILRSRAWLLRNAIVLQVLIIAFIVVTALLLIAKEVAGGFPGADLAVLSAFAAALLCFAGSLVFSIRDTLLSVRSVERDTR